MNCWPGFEADVWQTRNFAEHHGLVTWRWGLYATHRNGIINDAASFSDLILYVLTRLEVDPRQDEYKLAHEFIEWYYGVAAEPMRKFFDMAMAEPRRRDWIQNCEQRVNGLMGNEFADRAFPLLDEAEHLAGSDEALARRIRKQVIPYYWTHLNEVSRGCGNVPASGLKKWAHRVARFVKACKDNGAFYMGGHPGPKQWFHDIIMLDLSISGNPETSWLNAPEVAKLIADPEKMLAGDFPNLQKKTADGWEIPVEGMKGGELLAKCFWRKKDGASVRCVRRESSGFGLVFTRLDLDAAPAGAAKLVLTGIDGDKESVALVEVKVNSKVVYAGPVKWGKNAHSDWAIDLPAGLLKKGGNEVQVRNTTPDAEAAHDGEGGDLFRAKRNYFWGWIMLDKVSFVLAD